MRARGMTGGKFFFVLQMAICKIPTIVNCQLSISPGRGTRGRPMTAPTTMFRFILVISRELATEKSVSFFVNMQGGTDSSLRSE